jgi:protease IV
MGSPTSPEPSYQPPLRAEMVRPLPPSPAPPRRRRLGCLFLFLSIIGLGGLTLFGLVLVSHAGLGVFGSEHRVREEYVSHNRFGSDKVAIITLKGLIISGEGYVKRQIDQALKDDAVKAIVFRVDSPGGTVAGSDYIYHYMRRLVEERKIPIVVSMGSIAASGGYYVSMAVGHEPESIFAEPTTWTGSIGVKIPHYDLSKLLAGWGIKEDTIARHRLKTMGSFAKPMSEEERKIFQGLVDDSFNRFKQIIRDGRPEFAKDPKALDKLATGQVYTADHAVESGLVDKIGFIEDAVDRAIKMAGLDEQQVRVVKYKPEPTLASIFTGDESRSQQIDLTAILDAATPRAYYLHTWLPAAFSNAP